MRHALTHLLGLLGLAGLAFATGTLVVRAAPAIRGVRLTTGFLRVTLGLAAWAYGMFALATIGWLQRPVILSAAAAVLLAGSWFWLHERSRKAADAKPTGRGPAKLVSTLVWLAPSLVLAALCVAALGPDPGWDASAYHLSVPKLYLEAGGFRHIPYNVPSNGPLNVQMLFALAMVLQDHFLAKLLHWGFLVLLTVAVYRFASRVASRASGAIAVAVLLANQVVLFEAGLAYIDIAIAYFTFVGFAAMSQHLDEKTPGALLLAGICAGVAGGSKLIGAFVPVAFAFVLLTHHTFRRQQCSWRPALKDTVVLMAAAALFALPWYVRSAVLTGNPVYPALYGYFGGTEWDADLHAQLLAQRDTVGMGRTALDLVLLPVRLSLYGREHFQGSLSLLWLVLLPVAFLAVPSSATVRRCLSVAGLYVLMWFFAWQGTRYLIPILPLCAIAGAVALTSFLPSRVSGPYGRLWRGHAWVPQLTQPVGVAAGLVLVVVTQAWLLHAAKATLRNAVGSATFLDQHARVLPETVVPTAYRFANETLPASTRLMLLNTNQGFFLDHPYIADSFFEASQMNSLFLEDPTVAGIADVFRRLDVTHVLFCTRNWRIPYPPALWELLGDPRRARLVHRSPDPRGWEYLIFEVW